MSWLLLNLLISSGTLLALFALRSAPHRLRFFLCLAALACWFLPLGHMGIPQAARPAFLGNLSFALPIPTTGFNLPQKPELGLAEQFRNLILSPRAFVPGCFVGLMLFALQFRRHRRFLKQLENNAQDGNTLWQRLPNVVRAQVPIGIVARFKGAVTTGIKEPKIWVGGRHVNGEALPGLLLHEQTHIRHKDNLTLFLITLTRCLFWWNPFVHLLGSRARFHQELACDQACQRQLGGEEYRFQLATLLMEQAGVNMPNDALACGIASNTNIRRLKLLERSFRMKIRHYVVLLLLLAGSGLLVAQQKTIPKAAEKCEKASSDSKVFNISVIDVKDQPIVDLLNFFGDQAGFQVVVQDPAVYGLLVNYQQNDQPWDEALDTIITDANCTYTLKNDVLTIVSNDFAYQNMETPASIDLSGENESVFGLIYHIGEEVGVHIRVDGQLKDSKVSCNISDVPWWQALTSIAADAGMAVIYHNNTYLVMSISQAKSLSSSENLVQKTLYTTADNNTKLYVKIKPLESLVYADDGKTFLFPESESILELELRETKQK